MFAGLVSTWVSGDQPGPSTAATNLSKSALSLAI